MLRTDDFALRLVRQAHERGLLVVSLCHGPQVIISAAFDAPEGQQNFPSDRVHITGTASIRRDLKNAGFVVHNDNSTVYDEKAHLLTARDPNDLGSLCEKFGELLRQRIVAHNTGCDGRESKTEKAAGNLLMDANTVLFSDSNIVRMDSCSARYCSDVKDGDICKMTQQDAVQYCKEQGGHLPSAREFAVFLNPNRILEKDDVDAVFQGRVPKGYYKVASEDEDGKVDIFYFNHEGGRPLTGDIAKESFWTSSIVLGKSDFAHVIYGPLGGGGGPDYEHARTYRHAVICLMV